MASKTYVNPFAQPARSGRAEPSKPQLEGPKRPASEPPGNRPKPVRDKHSDVTVKLPGHLLAKLDRLVTRHSGTLGKAGRSTVLRWLLDQYPE